MYSVTLWVSIGKGKTMSYLMKYDKENKQVEYMHIARDKNNSALKIGFIVIEKPWYSPESEWKYYMYSNKYKPGGFCGGAIDKGFSRVEVIRDTIVPYNQATEVLWNMENGIDSEFEDIGITVKAEGKFPYVLWDDAKELQERLNNISEVRRNGRKRAVEIRTSCKNVSSDSFQSFVNGLVEEERRKKRNELLAAIMNFWNEHKENYLGIVIGINGDVEYIEEDEDGTFSSTMFDKAFDNIESIVTEFCNVIEDPNLVDGFNAFLDRRIKNGNNK